MSLPLGGLIIATPEQLGHIVEESVKRALASLSPQQPATPEFPVSDIMTREQVSNYLGVTYGTLNTWAKDTPDRAAILVPFKVGNRVRYHRSDVLAAFKQTRRYKDKHAD